MTEKLRADSPGFCIMPWIHLNVWTTGRIIPCCLNQTISYGNVRETSIEEAYNSPEARAFRLSMLQGKLPPSCSACAVPESTLGAESMRLQENKKNARHFDRVAVTDSDGRIPELKFVSLDVRLSNLCNLSCRMCNPSNSSELARDEQRLGRRSKGPTVRKSFERIEDFLAFLDRRLDHVEEFYFSGGEPLLLEEHYAVLRVLLLSGKTGVRLRYNSNLSRLTFAEHSALRYWKLFPDVSMGASLDASGARGEYIRKGARWSEIVANRKLMMEEVPHVKFWIAPTVQLMNAFCLPEFHLDWVTAGLTTAPGIHYNLLRGPSWYSLQVLTPRLKRKFRDLWMDYTAALSAYSDTGETVEQARKVIQFAFLQDSSVEVRRKFASEIRAFDAIRGESFGDVFPELREMLDGVSNHSHASRQANVDCVDGAR